MLFASLAAAALTAPLVAAHYTFPYLSVNGGAESAAFQYIRMTDNHYSNGPVCAPSTCMAP